MSKHDRKEVATSLKAQIKVTTDPEQLIKLTREYNRLTNPRYGGKRAVKEAKPSGKQTSSPIVAKWADRLSHVPEEKRIFLTVIEEYEERELQKRRTTGQRFTEAEKHALWVELFGMLSVEERANCKGWDWRNPEMVVDNQAAFDELTRARSLARGGS